MIEINIGALVVLMGIPTAVTGFCFWMLEHRIQKREKQKEAEEAKDVYKRQVYDGKAFKGGGTLLTDTLVVKAHGQSAAAVKDTDYTVDYTDGLLNITLKGSLSAAESVDIIITRTLEGCVKIVPLLEGGGIPDAAMLTKVLDAVNAKDIRPLTDKVSAVPPEVETYDIEIVYYTCLLYTSRCV